MSKALVSALYITLFFPATAGHATGPLPSVVVFSEAGFPAADSVSPSAEELQKVLPGARLRLKRFQPNSMGQPLACSCFPTVRLSLRRPGRTFTDFSGAEEIFSCWAGGPSRDRHIAMVQAGGFETIACASHVR
jgi:hypothetical protein